MLDLGRPGEWGSSLGSRRVCAPASRSEPRPLGLGSREVAPRGLAPGASSARRGGAAGADRPVCAQIVKELLSCGADPNMLLAKGLGSALCVACDITYESQRSLESRLALVSRGRGG